MKKLRLLIILVSLPFVTSCNNDDDSNPPASNPAEGTWNLINVSGGFGGEDNDFEEGLIKWTFNESEGTITVVNNNPADVYDGLGMGTYIYEYVPNTISNVCEKALEVYGPGTAEVVYNFGCQTVSGNTMTLSHAEADGYLLTFKR